MRASLASWLMLPALVAAQQPTFRSQVNLVEVHVTVQDRNGRFVPDLNKEDFLLEEDGRPQTIKHFSAQTKAPLDIGLLVDTSGSQKKVLEHERQATLGFIEAVFRPQWDRAFVLHFGDELRLTQDFTSSKEKLAQGMRVMEFGSVRLYPKEPPNCGYRGTNLYEAVTSASRKMASRKAPRKVLIVLSDGVDVGSCDTLDGAIKVALKSNVVIFTIWIHDPGVLPPEKAHLRAGGIMVLGRMAEETGGRFFRGEPEDLPEIYATLVEELKAQYVLAYAPERGVNDGEFRAIRVLTRGEHLVVQSRHGYYPARGSGRR